MKDKEEKDRSPKLVSSQPKTMNPLRRNLKRRERIAHLTRILAILNLLKPMRTILLQRHHPHLRLAAIAPKAELHNSTTLHRHQHPHPVRLVDEPLREERRQSLLVDEARMARDYQHPRLALRERLLWVFDAVVGDFDGVALDHQGRDGPRGLEEGRSSGRGEEDDFRRGGEMLAVVGLVDEGAPDAAEVADRAEELGVGDVGRQAGEPEGAVLVGWEVVGGGVGADVFAAVAGGEAREELGR